MKSLYSKIEIAVFGIMLYAIILFFIDSALRGDGIWLMISSSISLHLL